MISTPPPEREPATYGGAGWRGRGDGHAVDVAEGRLWAPCGVSSEVGRLREVLLSWPSDTFAEIDDADRWLMLAPVDLARMREEAEALARVFTDLGVTVHMHRPDRPPPPNYVFMRDLFFMCPEGAVVGRMAGAARAGEERFAAQALSALGVPILATTRGHATFEGADALWLDASVVLVGTGRRTNREGFEALSRLLHEMSVTCLEVGVPTGSQHLLGALAFIAPDLAVMRADRVDDHLVRLLRARGIDIEMLEPTFEVTTGLAMSLVTLAPRHVLLPAGTPGVRARLERRGVRCEEVGISQAPRAAGGLGCLTGILRRDPLTMTGATVNTP